MDQALKAAVERVSRWMGNGMPDTSDYTPHNDRLRADLRTLLAALSSQASVMEEMAKGLLECRDAEMERRAKLKPGAPATTYTSARLARVELALSQYRTLGDRHDD